MKRKQDTSFRVEAAAELMPFLLSKLGGMTRTSVKQLLSQRRVTVNAGIQTRHDTPLKAGDIVQVLQGRGNIELRHPKLRIIYEDDALIIVEKKNGLLTVPYNPKSSEMTAYSILKEYVKKESKRNTVHVVHRLDRETSGVLVFATPVSAATLTVLVNRRREPSPPTVIAFEPTWDSPNLVSAGRIALAPSRTSMAPSR